MTPAATPLSRCRAAYTAYRAACARAACLRDEHAWLKPRPRTVRRCDDLLRRIRFAEQEAADAVARMRESCREMGNVWAGMDAETRRGVMIEVRKTVRSMGLRSVA